MEDILFKITEYAPAILELLGALAVAATIIVRVTPSETDDEKVSKAVAMLLKVISWMPTIGINPRTKKLEEALKELKK